jgi:hypothetical protein
MLYMCSAVSLLCSVEPAAGPSLEPDMLTAHPHFRVLTLLSSVYIFMDFTVSVLCHFDKTSKTYFRFSNNCWVQIYIALEFSWEVQGV